MKWICLLICLTSLKSFAFEQLEATESAFGESDYHACKNAKLRVKESLDVLCKNGNLSKIEFNECRHIYSGNYYEEYSVSGIALCLEE